MRLKGELSLDLNDPVSDRAARHWRGGYIQPPARRRTDGCQQLKGGVFPPAFVFGDRTAVAERTADVGRADVPGLPRNRTTGSDHDISCPERTAQIVGIGGGGDEGLAVRGGGMLGAFLG